MMTIESGEDGADGVCGTSVACERTRTRVRSSSSDTKMSPETSKLSEDRSTSLGAARGMETTRADFSMTFFMRNLGVASGSETTRAVGFRSARVVGRATDRCSILKVRVVVVMDLSAEDADSKERSG